MKRPVVALDGPASSGKSSVGSALARALGIRFFDTGLLYRAVARAALDSGVDPADGPGVAALVPSIGLAPDDRGVLSRVLLDGADVSGRLRVSDVDRTVPVVSRLVEVRDALLAHQRALAAGGGIVLAGRDIGTVVLPGADVKIWLDASPETRAARRARERGIDPSTPLGREILADLRQRDGIDGGRAVAPSRPADDAVRIVTDGLDFDATVAAAVAATRRALDVPVAPAAGVPTAADPSVANVPGEQEEVR